MNRCNISLEKIHNIISNSTIDIISSIQKGSNNQQIQSMKKAHPKNKFTPEEDEHLKSIVFSMTKDQNATLQLNDNEKKNVEIESPELLSNINWNLVAKSMKTPRNARQCHERWKNYLSPFLLNGQWSQEEEELLLQKYEELGPHWKKIRPFFNNRTDINIKNHYHLLERRIKKVERKKMKELRAKQLEEKLMKSSLNRNKNQMVTNNLNSQGTYLAQVHSEASYNKSKSNDESTSLHEINSKTVPQEKQIQPLPDEIWSSLIIDDDQNEIYSFL